MDPIKMLKQDHKRVKALFKEFEELGESAFVAKQQLADKVCRELEIHAAVEEDIFYPEVKETSGKEAKKLVTEAYEEHLLMKRLIEEIQKLDARDEKFSAKMKVLKDVVEHHIKEEESQLFPEAKECLGEEEMLSEKMEEKKEELQEVFF